MTKLPLWRIIQTVNNFHSPSAFTYLKRWITPLLKAAVTEHRIVVLTGARQVGKSTLLQHAEPVNRWRYHTLDDFDVLRQAESDPAALWAGVGDVTGVVIDEVQKSPGLLSAVKQAVDRRAGSLRFVLSGSANLLLMRQVGESLAGRAVYFVLAPMTIGETHGAQAPTLIVDLFAGRWPAQGTTPEPPASPFSTLLRGLMPALLSLDRPEAWAQWWEGYVATYLERDLRQISQIDSLLDFRRVMELLALRSGQLLNQSEVARDARLSQSTVHRYLNVLEATHLLERLPAYTASRTTRLLKSPKVYWADPGLATFLAGYHDETSLSQAREVGAFFESLLLHHLRVLAQLLTPRGRLFFWRPMHGGEVDFVLEQGRRVLAFEVKLTGAPRYGDADSLRSFLKEHPNALAGVLIHTGREIKRLGEQVVAVPWSLLTG